MKGRASTPAATGGELPARGGSPPLQQTRDARDRPAGSEYPSPRPSAGSNNRTASTLPSGRRGRNSGTAAATVRRRARTESLARARRRTALILDRLHAEYPEAECALLHENPVQLLVATILSAQCTDERVNLVTPALFQKYPDAAALAAANREELEAAIHSTGFFRNKARNILACCQALVEEHGGTVPPEMEKLVTLAGVGRKTANVVRGACFGLPAITVDTHCGRLARRLGLTQETDPDKVERDLQARIPEGDWWFFSSAIIWHGRRVCHARTPECHRCILSDLCPSAPKGMVKMEV